MIRINHNYRPRLSLEWQKLKPLELDAAQTAKIAELAPIVEGKPDVTKIEAINLEKLAREFRTQRINLRDRARETFTTKCSRTGGAAGLFCWLSWCGWLSNASVRTESASPPHYSFVMISSAASSSRST